MRLGETILPGAYADEAALLVALVCAGLGYGVTVLLLRKRLPLGRFSQ